MFLRSAAVIIHEFTFVFSIFRLLFTRKGHVVSTLRFKFINT